MHENAWLVEEVVVTPETFFAGDGVSLGLVDAR
jgi:hypothetical protein